MGAEPPLSIGSALDPRSLPILLAGLPPWPSAAFCLRSALFCCNTSCHVGGAGCSMGPLCAGGGVGDTDDLSTNAAAFFDLFADPGPLLSLRLRFVPGGGDTDGLVSVIFMLILVPCFNSTELSREDDGEGDFGERPCCFCCNRSF